MQDQSRSGLDLDGMERVARAALANKPHAQPWGATEGYPRQIKHGHPWNSPVASCISDEIAEHIATLDPPTVIALIQAHRELLGALKKLIQQDDEAAAAKGRPGANMNGYGLVDLFDCVGHPFGAGEHKQQPYRSNNLHAALMDARAAISRTEAPSQQENG